MGIDIDLYIYSISWMALPVTGQDRRRSQGASPRLREASLLYIYIIIVYFISTVSGYLSCLYHLVERGLPGG